MTIEQTAPSVKDVVTAWARSLGLNGISKPFYAEDADPDLPRAWLVNVVFCDTYLTCNDRYRRHTLFYADPSFCDKMERLLKTGVLGD